MRKGIFKYPDNRFGGHLPKRIPEPSETRLSDNSVTHGFNDFMTQCRHSSLVRRTLHRRTGYAVTRPCACSRKRIMR